MVFWIYIDEYILTHTEYFCIYFFKLKFIKYLLCIIVVLIITEHCQVWGYEGKLIKHYNQMCAVIKIMSSLYCNLYSKPTEMREIKFL